jgi:hypothetical protein
MLLLALTAAGLLVGPEPDKKKMVSYRDYPVEMLRKNKSVFVEIVAIIDPKGEMESCSVTSFFGDEKFATQVCDIIPKRMWKSAQDNQGRPVYGRVRTSMRFAVQTPVGDRVNRMQLSPDFEVPLPGDWRGSNEINVSLAVLVGEDGHVDACKFLPEPFTDIKARELAELACGSVDQKVFGPIDTRMGPVRRYVLTQKVRFSRSEP